MNKTLLFVLFSSGIGAIIIYVVVLFIRRIIYMIKRP